MSLIVSFDVTIKCNSSFERVSEEGVECCQSSFTETHHLQPEHYANKCGNFILSTYASAIGLGWFAREDRVYCPACFEQVIADHVENNLPQVSIN